MKKFNRLFCLVIAAYLLWPIIIQINFNRLYAKQQAQIDELKKTGDDRFGKLMAIDFFTLKCLGESLGVHIDMRMGTNGTVDIDVSTNSVHSPAIALPRRLNFNPADL